jgi:predicted PolB exonuclease-like 3'-5' exonuclease
VATLSAKQLAYAWINQKLHPSKIQVDEEELQELNGGKPIKPAVLEEAKRMVLESLARDKKRYEDYVSKYCNNLGKETTDEIEQREENS